MSTDVLAPPAIQNLADLFARLGDVPPHRIRFRPSPGTATLQDVIDVEHREGRLCELVEGVLVEKAMGFTEARLAGFLLTMLNIFVLPRNAGIVTGPDGTVQLFPDLVRIPDVAFTSWDRLPGRRGPAARIPSVVPNLAVEVLSSSNTPGEMAVKRQDYFAAGVQLVWEIDPSARTATVYTSPTDATSVGAADTLTGGTVLPGFVLPLAQLFAELDRQG
jgi:Uma2 family endonuclease